MNHSIPEGVVPPKPGLEKEEPELRNEEDIARDDRPEASDETEGDPRRPRDADCE